MRLVIDVPGEEFDRLADRGLSVITRPLLVVEWRQHGSLLSHERRVVAVEPVSPSVAQASGIEQNPVIRVYTREKEE